MVYKVDKKQLKDGVKAKRAKTAGINRRQKNFADTILKDPTISNAAAYKKAYGTQNLEHASASASKLLKNPKVLQYMDTYAGEAEKRIIKLIDSDNERIALDAAKDILDRTKGKATQRSESVNLNMSIESFLNEQQ